MFNQDIGIDLGTANVLVHVRGRGIIMREPSVVAMEVGKPRVKEVGEKAREMLGRTPVNIVAVRPMTDGVIADYTTTQKLLEYIFHKICGVRRVFKPRVLLAVPSSATSVEKRAVKQAALAAGAGEALTIEEPMAAALGAGLPISAPGGNMVVDIGGGTTDIAVHFPGRHRPVPLPAHRRHEARRRHHPPRPGHVQSDDRRPHRRGDQDHRRQRCPAGKGSARWTCGAAT